LLELPLLVQFIPVASGITHPPIAHVLLTSIGNGGRERLASEVCGEQVEVGTGIVDETSLYILGRAKGEGWSGLRAKVFGCLGEEEGTIPFLLDWRYGRGASVVAWYTSLGLCP